MDFEARKQAVEEEEPVAEDEGVAEEAGEEAIEASFEVRKDHLPFVRILNETGLPYCMDSGVLLGLMREGKLLDHEKDIDLQMWAEHEGRLRELLPVFWQAGYLVTIWLYRGLIYQYRFTKEGELPVHLMLYRRSGEWAWCPAGEGIGPPFPRRVTRRFYRYFVIARKRLRDHLVATDVADFPWRLRRSLGTWWVHSDYFDHLIYCSRFETYVPEKWEEYLAFRYRTWQFPKRKWNFWRKDGALNRKPPEKMVDLSAYTGKNHRASLREVRAQVKGLQRKYGK